MKAIFTRYEALGFYLFPVQSSKIPYKDFKWRDLSSRDHLQWQEWADEYEGCAWAIDCGKSGLAVIDVDPRNGGSEAPFIGYQTYQVKTPSGGAHFYFLGTAPCGTPLQGVDLKSSGGYVLCPPSTGYAVIVDTELKKFSAVTMPNGDKLEERKAFTIPETIFKGARDQTIFRLACLMWTTGMNFEPMVDALKSVNEHQVKPPLSDEEVEKKAEQATRYQKGERPPALKNAKKEKYEDFKEYFAQQFPTRRFCPIKQELFVQMPYGQFELASAQESILKSLSHEAKFSHSLVKDHLAHWGSLKERDLHDNKMLIDIPKWDGKGRIGKFFGALPIKNMNMEHGYQLFKHYLANIWRRIDDPKTRNWALILVGHQDKGKDWWIRELLGAWDKRYYYENLNVFDDEIRTFMQIDGKVIINISEFDNTKKWDSAFLKDLITKEDLSYVGKYKQNPKFTPARHSIIASANKMDFLQDYTGSTRFLIFDLGADKIDFSHYPLNESIQVLAESRQLAEDGFRASQEALETLGAYQDMVTPENIPELIKTDFNALLANKDCSGQLTGDPQFWTVSELDEIFDTLSRRYQKTRRQLFDILKQDFGSGTTKKKGYKRRLQ